MQRMSRAQRLLLIYILWEMEKVKEELMRPRAVTRYVGGPQFSPSDLSTASIADLGTKNHDLLDGLLDDDHTQYLLINGSRAMTGDLDVGVDNDLILRSTTWGVAKLLVKWATDMVCFMNEAETGYINALVNKLWTRTGIQGDAAHLFLMTAKDATKGVYVRSYTGVATYNDVLVALNGVCDIPYAGDITFLAGKQLKVGNITAAGVPADQTKYFPVDDGGTTRYIKMYDTPPA